MEMRVHELAKQYGLTNIQMMEFLVNNSIDVQESNSIVELSQINNVIKKLEAKKNLGEHKNKTSDFLSKVLAIELF